MGSYRQALAESPAAPDVIATRSFGRTKAGSAASVNQDLGTGLGAFARISANDGANETWAFTESTARWRLERCSPARAGADPTTRSASASS